MAKSRRITCKRKRKESKKVRKPLRKQRLQSFNPIDCPVAKHIGIISFCRVMRES